MLILSRKIGEKIKIGNNVVLNILGIARNNVRIGIDAPKHITILRNEIYESIEEENVLSSKSYNNLTDAVNLWKNKTQNKGSK